MMHAGLPFDDIRALVRMMPGPDEEALASVAEREASLIKQPGSLGGLETLAAWAAGWQGRARPSTHRPLVAMFAASHAIAGRMTTLDPALTTRRLVEAYAAGGGAINQVCASYDLGLKVFDLALDLPTPDVTAADALDEAGCAATMAFGMECIAGGADLLCIAALGQGGSVSAAAIACALHGGAPEEWVAGGDAEAAGLVAAALAHHHGRLADPLEVLRRLGGRDIAACAGAILAGRLQRIPVILDGYAATASAAVLHALDATALDHCVAGHAAGPTHAALLEKIGLQPLLRLDITSPEGVGAGLACGILKAAIACHNDMATRQQAGWLETA
jgi:nicotinate-nucleotide--dimethylbenzimidazole phosphoribosyltransferase